MNRLDDLLRQEALDVHFQPILSLKQKVVVGLEALARPHAMSVGEMFSLAADADRLLELDRLCRRKALEEYRTLKLPNEFRPLLFFNFETSVIDKGVVGSGAVLSATQAIGLDPSDVVIEINESKVHNTPALKQFVDNHRELGFLIALDDLGAGYSNLPRIAQLRPHIIKLDRDLIANIDGDFFKQETMKSLVSLCKNIGCLVLAEGVETSAEMDTCAALGAELFQGFHFAYPQAPCSLDFSALPPIITEAARRLREKSVGVINARRLEGNLLHRLADRGVKLFLQSDPLRFDTILTRLVRMNQGIEAAYLLDNNGLQISNTYLGKSIALARSRLFAPAARGTDHSNKEYFFSLFDTGLERYTTDSYISLATGQTCRTVAVMINHPCKQQYVLCIDWKT